IERLRPSSGTVYLSMAAASIASGSGFATSNLAQLTGILKTLRADYAAGYLRTVPEIIHAEVFADFLESADHLLTEGYKDAAAVIAGSVLEDQLRKLGAKSNLPLTTGSKPKMLTELNQDLRTASVYNKVQMQVI